MAETASDKFTVLMTSEADASVDTLPNAPIVETALRFISEELPNITRRDAIIKANLPIGTVYTFRVPSSQTIVNVLYGRNTSGQRTMIILGVADLTFEDGE